MFRRIRVSGSEYFPLAREGFKERAERLFRAAISAYCSLSHPTRIETTQLEDLTLPLYDSVSDEGLRYVAAALSECAAPPAQLVQRLCSERVEISAPLVIRTPVLTDADLLSLIARKGVAHARVIARRKGLNPTIAALIRQIEANAAAHQAGPARTARQPAAQQATPAKRTEAMRDQLRGMMQPSTATTSGVGVGNVYPLLRMAALSGERERFIEMLAQGLNLDHETASTLTMTSAAPLLITALRALALTGEQALLIVACMAPAYLARPGAARDLVNAFAAQSIGGARQRVAEYQSQDHDSSNYARELTQAALARSA